MAVEQSAVVLLDKNKGIITFVHKTLHVSHTLFVILSLEVFWVPSG